MAGKSIWIIKQYAVPRSEMGNTRHFELAKRLVLAGHNVSVFAANFHYSKHERITETPSRLCEVEEVEGVKFVWVPAPSFEKNDWRRAWHFAVFFGRILTIGGSNLWAREGLDSPDLVIGCTVPPSAALAGRLLAWRHKAKFIFEIGDLWPQVLVDMGLFAESHPAATALRYLERFLVQKSDHVITPLYNLGDYFDQEGIKAPSYSWIPNGVNPEEFNGVADPEGSDGLEIVFIGTLTEIFDLEPVIEAMGIVDDAGYSDVSLRFVGDGYKRDDLDSLARRLAIQSVTFQAPVPRQAIPTVLTRADIGLFSLRDQPSITFAGPAGKKFAEYLAAGLPVLQIGGAKGSPIPDTGCGILARSHDPADIAEAIIEFASMPSGELLQMGKASSALADERYRWDKLGERLHAIVADLLEE